MRIVVTGGAGFIGANLCRALVEHPAVDHVVAIDDLSTGRRSNLAAIECELVEGSILDPSCLEEVLTGADSVVHLGARPSVPRSIQDPLASHHANVTGTLEVLEAVRRCAVPHVIVASSSSVYGANQTLPKHEDLVPMPVSPYAASKLAAESYALAYARSFGVAVLAFRLFNVFGPVQSAGHAYAAVVPTFISAALDGRPLPVHGDGTQTRDFTYVGSVAAIMTEAAVDAVTADGPINLAFGAQISLLEVIAELESVIGHPLSREHLPRRPGDVDHSQAATDRLVALFPHAVPVPPRAGLEETVRWFRGSVET